MLKNRALTFKNPLEKFNCRALELMEYAISQYKLVPAKDGNFGMAKSLMMYVQIDVNKHFKDLQPHQKKKLDLMLTEAELEFTKLRREKQKVICLLLKAKVSMAGTHQQVDRDKAIDYIIKAEFNGNKLKTKDLLMRGEILDFKRYVLTEFKFHEGALCLISFTKACPIVSID